MAEIISYPEKSILSENDYLLISDSQNSYITKKTKVSDINALVFSNAVEGSGTTNYIPKFTSTKVIGNSNIYDSGTNIGIGTNSPSQKLHVSGNARVTGAYYDSTDSPGTSGHILSSTVSGTRWVSTLPGGPYLPLTGGTLSGNLSILKSQPSFSLIDTSSGSSISYIQNIGGNLYHVAGGSSVDNIFQSGSTQTMVIKGNGNVGIGTTNPTNRLHVENGITKLDSKSFTSLPLGLYSNGNQTGMAIFADDPIANSGQINIDSAGTSGNNEIGMNFATGGFSSTNVKLSILNTGQLKAHSYGSGSFTGTATQRLAVDTNGNVIEIPIGSGPVDGSGTANYTARWIDTDTLGIGALYDNGTNVGIGTTSPSQKLEVTGNALINNSGDGRLYLGSTSDYVGNIGSDLYVYSSGQNIFYSGGSEQMRIKTNGNVLIPNGNVGIGTTSPSEKLEVIGNIKIIESGQSPNISVFHSDGSYAKLRGQGLFLSRATSYVAPEADNFGSLAIGYNGTRWGNVEINAATVKFENGANEWMRINSSGNVGIGTTSPVAKLTIDDSNVAGESQLTIGDTTSYHLAMGHNSAGNTDGFIGTVYNNDAARFDIRMKGTAQSDAKVTILGSGSVGIGTTSPASKFEVLTVDSNRYVRFRAPNNEKRFDFYTGGTGNSARLSMFDHDGATEGARIQAGGATWFNGGNVGIGTTSPSELLHVQGSNATIQTVESGGATVKMRSGSVGRFGTYSNNNLVFVSNSNDRMTIDSSGNVGIGTTSPSSKLEIAGSGNQKLLVNRTDGDNFFIDAQNGQIRLRGSNNIYMGVSGDLLTITNTNVGIGTTSPSEKLTVSGNSNITGRFAIGISAAHPTIDFYNQGTAYFNGSTTIDDNLFVTNGDISVTDNSKIKLGDSNDFEIYHNSTTNQNIIQSNLGRQLLLSSNSTIVQSSTSSNVVYVDTNSNALSDNAYIRFNGNRAQVGWIDAAVTLTDAGANKDIKLKVNNGSIFFMTSNTARMFVNSSGNVGIGTTSPLSKLNVNGAIKIEGENQLYFGSSGSVPLWEIKASGSDLVINDTGSNVGSVLFNNDEGIVLPRLTTTEINAISSPNTGLTVYNTTLNTLCFYNGSSWQKVSHTSM